MSTLSLEVSPLEVLPPGMLPLENRLPLELPRLTTLGQELDTSPEALGELESSSHLLDDAEALRTKMREDGYLFLPGYLDRATLLAARDEVAAVWKPMEYSIRTFRAKNLSCMQTRQVAFAPTWQKRIRH